jgi:hypothetical protein
MDEEKNLLPWIFGGLAIAAVAIAMTVGSSNGTAPRQPQAPVPIAHVLPKETVMTAPAAVLTALPDATIAQPQTTPAPAPTVAAVQSQPATAPVEPHSRIWECTINGQKTFSDSRCGDQSSVHEIGPINGMDPTPVLPHVRSNVPEPNYQAEHSYQAGQEDYNPDQQGFSNNTYPVPYPVFIGNPLHEHGRFEHEHRPHGTFGEPRMPHGPPVPRGSPVPPAPPVPHAPPVPRAPPVPQRN